MANEDNNLESSLILDLKPFQQALKTALSNVSNFGKQFKNAFGSFSGAAGKASSEMNRVSDSVRGATGEVRKMGIGLRDLERIVGGILLSQAFYGVKSAIEEAATALFDFQNEMAKAQIALEYFLETPEQASSFLQDTQRFAAETSFNTTQALTLSRRLLSAQFAPNDVTDTLAILNDAAAASGGTQEQLDRIVLALTQIKTNGKLAGQELRQLAEAGIPAYQIAQEELGLTGEEVLNAAKLKIPGDQAVQAILNGLEKRYKGAADRIADTIPGALQTISDDSKIVGTAIFAAPYAALGEFLLNVRDTLSEFREAVFAGGLGRALEELFPEELWMSIRRIAGSIKSLGTSFVTFASAVKPVVQLIAGSFIHALGILLPILASIARGIANVTQFALQSIPGLGQLAAAFGALLIAQTAARAVLFLWGALRLGAIAQAAAAAVTLLAKSIQRLTLAILRNPIVLGIVLLTTALLHFTVGIRNAIGWLDTLINRIAGLAGFDPDLQLPNIPDSDDTAVKDYTARWEGLADGADAAEDAADKTEGAAKKFKKFLAAFDEVFQVPEPEDDGGEDGKGDFSVPDIPPLTLDDLAPIDLPEEIKLPEFVLPPFPEIEFPPIFARLIGGNFQWPKWPPFPPLPAIAFAPGFALEAIIEAIRNRLKGLQEYLEGLRWRPQPIPVPTLAPGWGLLPGVFEGVGQALRGLGGVFDSLRPGFELVLDGIQNKLNAFGGAFVTVWDGIVQGTQTALSAIGSGIAATWEAAQTNTMALVAAIGTLLAGLWIAISGGARAGLASMGVAISDGWTNIKASTSAFVTDTISTITGWVTSALGFFTNFGSMASGLFQSITQKLAKFWEDWGFLVKEILFIALSVLLGVFTAGLGTIALNVARWVPRAANLFKTFGPTVIGFIKKIPGQFTDIFNGIIKGIPNLVSRIASAFGGLGTAIFNSIKNIPSKFAEVFKNIKIPSFSQIGDGIKTTFTNLAVPGYETGGIIQKEHLAMVGEGNKREAVIPLENSKAMAPFASAVADLLRGVPTGSSGEESNSGVTLQVGVLVADDRGLRELERKLQSVRPGITARGTS